MAKMNETPNHRTLASMLLGPSFMSQVRAVNSSAKKLDLRQTLTAKQAYPNNRDRLPETIGANFPEMIQRNSIVNIDKQWHNKTVAIIGAGAAGLCAGYELMRCGLIPVFFEMQTVKEEPDYVSARHGGRAFSQNFSDVNNTPAFAELGCMRFPKSHTTLRTYTDKIFNDEYHYKYDIKTKWPAFIDPLLFDGTGDIPQNEWKVVYDTVLYARAINNRKYTRINAGTTFADLPKIIQNVSQSFADLLFGASSGILNDLVNAYAVGGLDEIKTIWGKLNDSYQDKSIFEVLRDHGWEDKDQEEPSRLEIFGELGLGSGGFDAFWGTTFMEILRIKIHEDEVNQDAFVGGSSYMLAPFLIHKTEYAGNQNNDKKSLADVTDGHVVYSPVIEIRAENNGGVRIITEDNVDGYLFACAVLTASPTAISSSIAIDEAIFSADTWRGIRNIPLTGSGKIFIAFDSPFWKGSSKTNKGRDSIVTTVTDEALRQVYTFDDYYWKSGSEMGVLMMSYTWGDWAHKMGSLSSLQQVRSAIRMLKKIYAEEWDHEWDNLFDKAIGEGNYTAINWSHQRGVAGGYRMADLNRYQDQLAMWHAGLTANNSSSPVFLAGEACAWLGLSGWIEGALHTGINATSGVGEWFNQYAANFNNWDKVVGPDDIKGSRFASIVSPTGRESQ